MGYNWTAADSDISFPEGFCAGLSLFSRSFLSLAAWQRQDGLPGSPAVAHSVGSARPDRPFSVYQRKPIRACLPSCSLCHRSVCTTFARVNTVILLTHSTPIYQPTEYHSTNIKRHSPLASAVRRPARSALKRDIRALTSPPAWLALLRAHPLHLLQRPLDNACLYSFARDKYLLHHHPFATLYPCETTPGSDPIRSLLALTTTTTSYRTTARCRQQLLPSEAVLLHRQ